MCGIAGIIGQNVDPDILWKMARVQHHRGPDGSGIYVDPKKRAGLAHNRLSIIDLSESGHQPMTDDAGLWLTYNGEIYNAPELRALLPNYPYKSKTDSEIILATYRKWGDRCVEKFNGMFAFALWDENKQKLFCARDRLGIKPFHFTQRKGQFLFASEIKALLVADVEAIPDLSAWGDYLLHGFSDHSDRTFFEGIDSLQPATTLTIQNGQLTKRNFWDQTAASDEPYVGTYNKATEELRALIDDAVKLNLRSDVSVGISLSGGLDSATMMSTVDAQLNNDKTYNSFTAKFDDPKYDEAEFADKVPRKKLWDRHYSVLSVDQMEKEFSVALHHQEAPFGGVATLALQKMHRIAKTKNISVLLEGQGVDEIFGGYAYYQSDIFLDLLERGFCSKLRSEFRSLPSDLETMLKIMRTKISGSEEPLYQDGTSHLRPESLSHAFKKKSNALVSFSLPFKNRFNNAMYRDLCFSKLPRVLRMHDRMAMASSVELRPAFLDHRIVEFAFRLPNNYKYDLGVGKRIWRNAMKGRLPDTVRLAPKRGVVAPQREWLRGPLRDWVKDIITSNSFNNRGIFDSKRVNTLFDRFCRGEGDNAFFVWQWVSVELWFQKFIDKNLSKDMVP